MSYTNIVKKDLMMRFRIAITFAVGEKDKRKKKEAAVLTFTLIQKLFLSRDHLPLTIRY